MPSRISIIGSSHIAKESIEKVEKEIETFSPDIVALELDSKRAYALMQKKEPKKASAKEIIRSVGFKGYVIASIGSFTQKKLGDTVGVKPGSEMKKALLVAKKKGIRIEYIDQDIEVTLRKFANALTWREKWRFFKDIAFAPFSKDKNMKFDLSKVPEEKIIKELLKEVKVRYPSIYNVLVAERNAIMAKRLFRLSRKFPEAKILAVVGAGHREEILAILKKLEKEN